MVKIEIGVVTDAGITHWPAAYRTYAERDEVKKAMEHLLNLAKGEKIAGIRTTLTRENL